MILVVVADRFGPFTMAGRRCRPATFIEIQGGKWAHEREVAMSYLCFSG